MAGYAARLLKKAHVGSLKQWKTTLQRGASVSGQAEKTGKASGDDNAVGDGVAGSATVVRSRRVKEGQDLVYTNPAPLLWWNDEHRS